MTEDAEARAAAVVAALRHVEPGMTIGLGSGRAVFALADALAGARSGPGSGAPPRVTVASPVTEARARAAGLEVVALDDAGRLDLAIDGADEVDPRLDVLKGGGAALLREKLVMASADRVLIVAERRKYVERLGSMHPLPVEVVRFGWATTRRSPRRATTCSTAPFPPATSPIWPPPSSPRSASSTTASSSAPPPRPSSATTTAPSPPCAARVKCDVLGYSPVSSGVSSAAECQSQSGSAFQSTVSHGGCRPRPCSDRENHESSTRARCLSIPPRVIDEAATVAPKPAASSPEHFHARA